MRHPLPRRAARLRAARWRAAVVRERAIAPIEHGAAIVLADAVTKLLEGEDVLVLVHQPDCGAKPGRCRSAPFEPRLDSLASQFAQGIGGDPAGRSRTVPAELFPAGDRCGVERHVALANASKRPIHCLLHEVALVGRSGPDDRKECHELLVGGGLVVHGQARQDDKPGSSHELLVAPGPLAHLGPPKRTCGDEIRQAVADVPGIDFANPTFERRLRHGGRIGDQGRELAGLMDARVPDGFGQRVVLADAFRQGPNIRNAHAHGIVSMNTDASVLGVPPWVRNGQEFVSYFIDGVRVRGTNGACQS